MSNQADFHDVLGIPPGEESRMYVSRLKDILTIEPFSEIEIPIDTLYQHVDTLYEKLMPGVSKRDFIGLASIVEIRFEELDREVAGSIEAKFWELPNGMKIGIESIPETSLEAQRASDLLKIPEMKTRAVFSGFGDEEIGNEKYKELSLPSRKQLNAILLVETHRHGAVEVPPDWNEGNFAYYVHMPYWSIYVCDGISFYLGQHNQFFDALGQYTRFLFSQDKYLEETALFLWDEIGGLVARHNWGGMIDGLRLLRWMPPQYYRAGRIFDQVIDVPNEGVRLQIAKEIESHPFSTLIEPLARLTQNETVSLVAQKLIRSIRLIGGERGFEGLLEIARFSPLPEVKKMASRALAWVVDYPSRKERIMELCRSSDREIRSAGFTALGDSKYHSVFDYGSALASEKEDNLRDALKDLAEGRADENQRDQIRDAFINGYVTTVMGEEAVDFGGGPNSLIVRTRDDIALFGRILTRAHAGRKALRQLIAPEFLGDLADSEDPKLEVLEKELAHTDNDLFFRLSCLSLFPSTFSLEAAAFVWGDSSSDAHWKLGLLHEGGFVLHDSNSNRYFRRRPEKRSPHAAHENLIGGSGLYQAAARHSEYHLSLLGRMEEEFTKMDDGAVNALANFDLEWMNIRAGQAWAALYADHDDLAAKLCCRYPVTGANLLVEHLTAEQRLQWLGVGLAAARRLGLIETEGALQFNLGIAFHQLGDNVRAIVEIRSAASILTEAKDSRAELANSVLTWLVEQAG